MASNVQIVLKENVKHLGELGELVRVKRGYARNYLLPRGMAVMATRGNVKQVEHEQKLAAKKKAALRAELDAIAKEISNITLMIPKTASPEGKLFGSITNTDILEALALKGIEKVDKKQIVMPDTPIKEVGKYAIQVQLGHDVRADVNIEVKTRA